MRILHIHDKPFAMPVSGPAAEVSGPVEAGGIEVYLSCIAGELLRRGHELSELRFGEGVPADDARAHPRRHRARSSSVVPRRSAMAAVEGVLRQASPDVVHLHSPYYAVHPTLLARIGRRWPTVLTQHDVTPFCMNGTKLRGDATLCERRIGLRCLSGGCFRSGRQDGLLQDLVRVAIGPAKLGAMATIPVVVVPSRYLRDEALRHGLSPERVRVLPQFPEFAGMEDVPPPEARRILFVGRLVAEKGAGRLIDALALLQTPGWEVTIAGDGPLAEVLRSKAAHLPGTVHFAGTVRRRDLPRLFAWSNVVVVPSLIPESFGLVGVEAMALGRPVVAFRAGGITEWLHDNETGLFARHGDAADLAQKIDRLLSDRPLQAAMGRRARQDVRTRFGITAHVDRLETFYGEARRLFHDLRAAAPTGMLAA